MGTQKKLVLASATSMMLALVFMAGFVPSFDAAQTGASGADGRVDMAGLLDMILGEKAAITAIVPASPVDGFTYVTPVMASGSETPYIPVGLTATASPAGATGDVYYVVDPLTSPGFSSDAQGSYWSGTADQYVGPVPATPFPATFDLGPEVPATVGLTQYAVNALANISRVYTDTYNGSITYIYYRVKNSSADSVQVNLRTVAAAADADSNGLADDLFGITALGTWVAEVDLAATGNPEIRDVLERDLSVNVKGAKAAGTVIVTPRPDVTVELPSEAALVAAGVGGGASTIAAIVSVTDEMSGAIDAVTQSARQQWADAVLAGAPGALIPGAPIVQIAFVANVGGVPTQITDLKGLTAKVTITGLTDLAAHADTGVAVWGVHTATNGSVLSAIPGNPADAWYTAAASPTVDYAKGTLQAELSSFSAFVPLYSELRITDIDPKLIPADIQVPITLTGIFPTAMAANVYAGLTVAEAAAEYKVFIGAGDPLVNGTPATFRSVDTAYTGPAGVPGHTGVAVTALKTNPLVPNKMYLTSPIIPVGKATSLNVAVQSVANPGNSFTLPATLQVSATGEVVVTMSGPGSGSVTLDPPHGSLSDGTTVVDFPANRYLRGTKVTATALPTGTSKLTAWSLNGTVSGNGATFDFTVFTDPTNLNAQFDLKATSFQLTVLAPVNGSISLSPAQPADGYPAGQTVTLTAVPAVGYQFNQWNGPNADSLLPSRLVSPASVVMNSPKTISAEFLSVAATKRLSLAATPGGTVVADPRGINGGILYTPNSPVKITAQASSSFLFDRWTGASAASLADATNPVQNILMSDDKEFLANFRQKLNITGILPEDAWIFGGVVARVSGTGLVASTKFTLGGKVVWGFNPAADGSSIEIVIPPTDDRSDNPLVIKWLTAEQGGALTPGIPFTYKRFSENRITGVNTTAFILNNPGFENTIKLGTGGNDITSGKLTLPGLNTDISQLYGIVLDKKRTAAEVKSTTAPVPVGDLSSSLIDNPAAGTGIENTYDFSVFLYAAPAEKAAMPPVQSSIYVDARDVLAATLGQGQDANGIPNAGTAMKVTLPLDGTGLTYSDVRKGLALWAIESQYDPAGNTESFTDPKVEAYQSELLQDEVDPSLQLNPKDSAKPSQMLSARIYSLNGFSLRKGWTLPAEAAAGVRLAKVDGKAVSGAGSGPVAGGTVLTLVSPKGGLGCVDRIVMRQPAKQGGTVGGTATQTLFVSAPGVDEYSFEFKTPKSGRAGKVDVVVYLKSNPQTPAAVLSQSFEYKAAPFNIFPLLLLLLSILLGLIGITAAVG